MALVRRNAWTLGTAANPWDPILLGYANAVGAMQALPISDPRSWRYQAAIHGLAGTTPPSGAPWNECQHSTWFFLPWHRMYLFQFERIVRSFVVKAGGPADWCLPYWNYEQAGQSALPPAFRAPTLPSGQPNPLLVPQRRGGTGAGSLNAGATLPSSVTSSSASMAVSFFETPSGGAPVGFGGPRTGFAHFGPAPGALEQQPHNIVHVAVGGNSGLMTDPDTAALDPIFWLHHANIDRLWESWRLSGNANAQVTLWTKRTFRLRDDKGKALRMKVADVLDCANQLNYTYEGQAPPAHLAAAGPAEEPVAKRTTRRPAMIGRSDAPLALPAEGATVEVPIGPLPPQAAAGLRAGAAAPASIHLELGDIEGDTNPGVVYGVYVNLPEHPSEADLEQHRVGLVSLFGIEHTRTRDTQPLRYLFDITGHVEPTDAVKVTLRPMADLPAEEPVATTPSAAAVEPVRIGTVAIHVT